MLANHEVSVIDLSYFQYFSLIDRSGDTMVLSLVKTIHLNGIEEAFPEGDEDAPYFWELMD